MAKGKGVSLSVVADVKEFLAGIKRGVIEPLEEVSDTLQDVAKDGSRAGDKLEDAMRDAQKDTERLGDEYDQLNRKVRDAGKGARTFGTDVNDATRMAARDLGELKDEALQNASETFSSFDGSVDSFVDGIQGTFGGIVSNMGPVGAVLGGTLALGIGVGVAKGEELAEAINTAKERAAELAAELVEADGDLSQIQWAEKVREWGLAIEDSREWWEFWQEDAKTAMEVAAEYSEKTGLALKDLALGLSGIDSEQATRSVEELTDQLKELEDQYNTNRGMSAGPQQQALLKEIDTRKELIEKLKQQGGVTDEAIELNKMLTEVTDELAAADEAAAAATEARAEQLDAVQRELDDAIDGWADYVNAESGAIDPAAYIAGMTQRREAIANFNQNVQSIATEFGLSQAETQAILDQGLDFAPHLQSIIDSGFAGAYVAEVQAGVDGAQSIVDGTPIVATVTSDADTTGAEQQLSDLIIDRTTSVEAEAETTDAGKALDTVAEKPRTAKITASVETAAASRALADFINRTRTVTLTAEIRDREGKIVP